MSSLIMLLAMTAVACGSTATATPVPPTVTRAPAPTAAAPGPTATLVAGIYRPEPTAVAPLTTPTAKPSAVRGKPKVDTLVMAADPAAGETNFPWAGTVDHHQQFDLVMEVLVDIDPVTSILVPELAKTWKISTDGKEWTFELQKGVQWHNSFGEFTAKDVLHSAAQYQRKDSLLAFANDWRQIDLEKSRAVSDYEVVLSLKNPNPDYLFFIAPSGGGLMMSKAQWDKGGDEAYKQDMIGTGPYRYTGRTFGVNTTYERLPNHWRRNNPPPDFQKVDIRWIKEPATRNAGLLASEVHMTELTRELADAAVKNKGMKIIQSKFPGYSIYAVFQGLFPAEPGNFNPPFAHPELPYSKVKVREAMNRAIDKKAINNALFSGRATPAVNGAFWVNQAGWNKDWVANFEEKYGYNPQRSRELLAEAGYGPNNRVKIKGILMNFFGFPEYPDLLQAMQVDFEKVGIDMTLEEWQFTNFIASAREKKPESFGIWIIPSSPLLVYAKLSIHNRSQGFLHTYETAELDAVFGELQKTVDLRERDRLTREMGNIIYDTYGYMPVFEAYIEWTVNPNIVDQWPFPGNDGANYGHFDLITACTTPTPCLN